MVLNHNIDNIKFNIFDENKEEYNLGDLLNMPYFFFEWNNTPHANEEFFDIYNKISLYYNNNILGIYESSRIDKNEPIPNVQRIRDSVNKYYEKNISLQNIFYQETLIDKKNEMKNTKNTIDTYILFSLCSDKNALFVHLRSGDKGVINDDFIKKIQELSFVYNKIIILCGMHKCTAFSSIEDSITNFKISLNKLKIINNSKIIIDISEPDIHICAMSKAKNLLVHLGGFSILGSLVFTGDNLYITNDFYPLKFSNVKNNNNFFSYINNYTII